MAFEVQLLHFISADLLPLSICVLIEVSGHRQSGGRGRPADIPEHNPQCPERLPLPVPADLAEEAMLNRIPLRAPRWVVTDGYGQLEAVAEMLLQIDLPGSGSAPVAAAPIRQDQEVADEWPTWPPGARGLPSSACVGRGGLTMSEEGGLEEVEESLR